MIRLNAPNYNFLQTLEQCIEGITGNNLLKAKVNHSKNALNVQSHNYLASAQTGELYTFSPLRSARGADPTVIDNLTKSELVKLYDLYLVKPGKPGRSVYNSLLLAADEKCPFCGGIGRPRNLDHFLPKAHFPLFSVVPNNLVPSCRDCNMDGKGQDFAVNKSQQVIQPYLDDIKFFDEQWIFASYAPGENNDPGTFIYFVNPPDYWEADDKSRVITHFTDFELAVRFATKAAEELVTSLAQINLLKGLGISNHQVKQTLVDPVINEAPFVNHWRRGMYQALADTILI
jgi:hypothetical protein